MLKNHINRAVFKIFKVSENSAINDIRHFSGLCDIGLLYKRRHAGFERKIGSLMHPMLQTFVEGVFLECFNFFCDVCLT